MMELQAIEYSLSALDLDQEGKQPELDRPQIDSAPFEPNFELALINTKAFTSRTLSCAPERDRRSRA